jgi:hypothetical protein
MLLMLEKGLTVNLFTVGRPMSIALPADILMFSN